MNRGCSPQELNFCIRQCVFSFIIQLIISLGWVSDFIKYDEYEFQPFLLIHQCISIICAVLFQIASQKNVYDSVRMLTYLKRLDDKKGHKQGRFANIILSFMQVTCCLISIFTLIFTFTKEPSMKMIIKSFATIAFSLKIDKAIVASFPPSVISNANELNKKCYLKFSKDNNSYKAIFRSLKSVKMNTKGFKTVVVAIANIAINIYFGLIISFVKIMFNYLIPYVVLIL